MTETIRESRQAAALREEVRTWLQENWNAERPAQEWLGMLADTGYGWPTWPKDRYGLDLDNEMAQVVYEEFFKLSATTGTPIGHNGLTVRDFCNDEQKVEFLRPLVTGEKRWCQLFSEPSAGSDLAGLQTRADRHGDEWIVNGQKVWTSGAVGADYGILLARTDWEVPKHQGISMFLFPLKQDGVEVRPIKQMTGGASFNEEFFTDARVPHKNLLGAVNGGWAIAMRTLSHERNRGRDAPRTAAMQAVGVAGAAAGGRGGRRGARGDAQPAAAQQQGAPTQAQAAQMMAAGFGGGADYRTLAKETGKNADPAVRQMIARLYSMQQVANWTNQRTAAARAAGKPPGPEVSIGKLAGTQIGRLSANLNGYLLGAGALASDATARSQGVVQSLLGYHSGSIAAGTDDVQRNIMGERVLGLPKDPQVDVDIPFKDTKRSAAVRSLTGRHTS